MSREVIPSPYSGQEAESGAIVVSTAKSSCIKNRAIDALRRDREAHRHNTIWTKDSHGGPYRKVREGARLAGLVNDHIDCRVFDVNLQANPKNGYDPLLQKPDGTLVETELGFHQVETGPTSNFVGNHMTQGAIDLVQAELGQKSSGFLKLDAARRSIRQLCSTPHQTPLVVTPRRQLPAPIWRDDTGFITINFSIPYSGDGGGRHIETEITSEINTRSLDFTVIQTGIGETYGFNIPSLWAEIVPPNSRIRIKGVSGDVDNEYDDFDELPGSPQGRSFSTTVVLEPLKEVGFTLAKADSSITWDSYASKASVPVLLGTDLAALRQIVRERRG